MEFLDTKSTFDTVFARLSPFYTSWESRDAIPFFFSDNIWTLFCPSHYDVSTVVENHQISRIIKFSKNRQNWPFLAFLMNFCPLKMSQFQLSFWHFLLMFVLLKLTCLVTLFDLKLQVSKNRQFWVFLEF